MTNIDPSSLPPNSDITSKIPGVSPEAGAFAESATGTSTDAGEPPVNHSEDEFRQALIGLKGILEVIRQKGQEFGNGVKAHNLLQTGLWLQARYYQGERTDDLHDAMMELTW